MSSMLSFLEVCPISTWKGRQNLWMLMKSGFTGVKQFKKMLFYLFQKILWDLPPVDPGCPQELLLCFLLPALGQEPTSRLWEIPDIKKKKNILTENQQTITFKMSHLTLVWVLWPVEYSPNNDKRAEEHQQRDPPATGQVSDGRQQHQARGGKKHDCRGTESRLRGISPLQPLNWRDLCVDLGKISHIRIQHLAETQPFR